MISSYDVGVNQSLWSMRRYSLRVRDGTKRSPEETRNCSRAAVVSGWNACAGGFNRGRGRGRGDSIVALQLGLVRVSRLAAQPRYAPSLLRTPFRSPLSLRSVVGFAIEREPRFRLEDLAENFLSIDLVSIIRPASWRNGNAYATYVFDSVYSGSSLLARPADCRGVSRRACATIVSTCGFGTRDRSDYSRFSQRTITGPSCCRALDVIKSDVKRRELTLRFCEMCKANWCNLCGVSFHTTISESALANEQKQMKENLGNLAIRKESRRMIVMTGSNRRLQSIKYLFFALCTMSERCINE